MSTPLNESIQRLEVTAKVTLGVLSLAAGIYTYLGVRELLNPNTPMVLLAAIMYSVAVSVGIYAFWSFLMRLMPHVVDYGGRLLLILTMLLGSLMIVAMSAWLNATALAGSAALEQHLSVTLQNYTRELDQAHRYALQTQGLLPDIQMASTRFARLADGERTGSLTGTAGSGTVVQLLSQMSNQLGVLSQEVTRSGERVQQLYEQGGNHLAKMRELVSSRTSIKDRSDAFGTQAIALLGVMAALQQTTVAPAVKRAADDLTKGFIAPSVGGRTPDLAGRQSAVVSRVEAAVAVQSQALAAAAEKIMAERPIESGRFQAISMPEAVLRYAGDFIPSWAGAISIDLLPGVLVLILCAAQASARRQGDLPSNSNTMSAADLVMAVRLAREIEEVRFAPRPEAPRARPAVTGDRFVLSTEETPREKSAGNGADSRAFARSEEAPRQKAAAPDADKRSPSATPLWQEELARPPEENVTTLALAAARAAKKE